MINLFPQMTLSCSLHQRFFSLPSNSVTKQSLTQRLQDAADHRGTSVHVKLHAILTSETPGALYGKEQSQTMGTARADFRRGLRPGH